MNPALRLNRLDACICVPVYNHGRTVGQVVSECRRYASTVLVCDDGSTDGSGARAAEAGGVLLTHPGNQGKGAALGTLFREARKRGFRYAFTLDADGQHYPKDVERLAAVVEQVPGALVVGARDLVKAGAPASSEFGRKFSNFWTWLETGQHLEDCQTGFRAYPLEALEQLGLVTTHYDYEIEVLVRAGWAGVPLRSAPIDVLYPKDRVTHFDKLRDNARLSLFNWLACMRLFVPWPLGPRLGQVARGPGLSLFQVRNWLWLGRPGLASRLLAVGAGAGLALAGSPWAWAVGLAAAASGVGVFPYLAALWGTRWALAAGAPGWLPAVAAGAAAVGLGLFESRRKQVGSAG